MSLFTCTDIYAPETEGRGAVCISCIAEGVIYLQET